MMKKFSGHPTERADLFGKRLAVCVETEDNRRLAESLVKELTGGDRSRSGVPLFDSVLKRHYGNNQAAWGVGSERQI